MITYLFFNLFVGIHSILFCLWGLVLFPFDNDGQLIHRLAARPWAKIILWAGGVKIQVNGLEHIDMNSAHVFMVNHQSYFDIFAVLAGIPVDFKFIMKQELMRVPILGPAMRMVGYIGIERTEPRKAIESINKAVEKIHKGASVLIFPEGTRNAEGRVQSFKKGGFHLALKSGKNIIPVSIINSHKIVSNGRRRINKGTIVMNIGKPVPTTEYSRKTLDQLINRVRDIIINQMRNHKGIVS